MVDIASGVNIGSGIYMGVEKTPIYPTAALTAGSNPTFDDIAWDGNQTMLAVAQPGYGATVTYSMFTTNLGLNWNVSTIPVVGGTVTNNFTVTYGNGRWVAISGRYGYYSTDGSNWTQVTGLTSTIAWETVRYGNGLFIATAAQVYATGLKTNVYATSTDGITWTSRTLPASYRTWYNLVYGNGLWVLSAYSSGIGTAGDYTFTSPDGINWTSQGQVLGYDARRGIYANGLFLVPCGGGFLYYSSDGITWSPYRVTSSGPDLCDVAYLNGVYVATTVYNSGTSGTNYVFSSTSVTGPWTTRLTFSPDAWYPVMISGAGYQSNPTPGFVLLWRNFVQPNGPTTNGVNVSYNGVDWI